MALVLNEQEENIMLILRRAEEQDAENTGNSIETTCNPQPAPLLAPQAPNPKLQT
jgi:hypothetical protein